MNHFSSQRKTSLPVAAQKNSLTILTIYLLHESLFRKIFEGEIFIKTQSTIHFEIFGEFMIYVLLAIHMHFSTVANQVKSLDAASVIWCHICAWKS